MSSESLQQTELFQPRTPMEIALAHADQFAVDFLEWLPENLHVWRGFERETFSVIKRGYKHYSSYTIIEFMRHHTSIHEAAPSYKLNNNYRPYLPRLFDLVHPEHAGLFEYRVTTKEKGKK